MDEGLFVFSLIAFIIVVGAVVYCFLSSCLGLQLRQSDLWDALSHPRSTQYIPASHQHERFDVAREWDGPLGGQAEAIELMTRAPGRYFHD